MVVGISTACFFDRCMVEDAPKLLREFGVSDTEIFLNSFCEYESTFVRDLHKNCVKYGIRVHNVHPMSSMFESQLFSIHPRQKQDAFRIFEQVLQAAKALGAKRYILHGAAHMSGAAKNLEPERMAATLDELCLLADRYGITVALENVSWCFYREPRTALDLLERMRSDRLRFTLDIKQAIRSGQEPLEFVETLGDRIEVVHICDCDRNGERPFYCLPPKGGYDFAGLFGALRRKGFDGTVMFEVYSDLYQNWEELRDSYQSFHRILSQQI